MGIPVTACHAASVANGACLTPVHIIGCSIAAAGDGTVPQQSGTRVPRTGSLCLQPKGPRALQLGRGAAAARCCRGACFQGASKARLTLDGRHRRCPLGSARRTRSARAAATHLACHMENTIRCLSHENALIRHGLRGFRESWMAHRNFQRRGRRRLLATKAGAL